MTAQYDTEQRVNRAADNAVRLWGARAQLRQLTEECGELIAAVNQHERGRITDDQLASEVADVIIMVGQARRILGAKVDAHVAAKLDRLEGRIEAAHVNGIGGVP